MQALSGLILQCFRAAASLHADAWMAVLNMCMLCRQQLPLNQACSRPMPATLYQPICAHRVLMSHLCVLKLSQICRWDKNWIIHLDGVFQTADRLGDHHVHVARGMRRLVIADTMTDEETGFIGEYMSPAIDHLHIACVTMQLPCQCWLARQLCAEQSGAILSGLRQLCREYAWHIQHCAGHPLYS